MYVIDVCACGSEPMGKLVCLTLHWSVYPLLMHDLKIMQLPLSQMESMFFIRGVGP